jgi:hypothetical protein
MELELHGYWLFLKKMKMALASFKKLGQKS